MRFKQKDVSQMNYLRVVIVTETFGEGVVVYFQLRDLCKKRKTEPGDTVAQLFTRLCCTLDTGHAFMDQSWLLKRQKSVAVGWDSRLRSGRQ